LTATEGVIDSSDHSFRDLLRSVVVRERPGQVMGFRGDVRRSTADAVGVTVADAPVPPQRRRGNRAGNSLMLYGHYDLFDH